MREHVLKKKQALCTTKANTTRTNFLRFFTLFKQPLPPLPLNIYVNTISKIYLLTKGFWNYTKCATKLQEFAPLTFWTMLNEWFSNKTRIFNFLCEHFSNVLMFSNIKYCCRSKKEWDLGQLKGVPNNDTNQMLSEPQSLVHWWRDQADSCVSQTKWIFSESFGQANCKGW